MSAGKASALRLQFHTLTPDRWQDLEVLFGDRGACGGCWCMWWKLKRSQFVKGKGEGNRKAFKRIVQSGEIPGLIAYAGEEPVAWCALAPRDVYPTLERSRILKPVDEEPVWSVTCFFVARPYRGQGITVKLLKAAVQYAGKNGARIVEGYPVEPKKSPMPAVFAYTGVIAMFRAAGFVEVLRRSKTRPIMRYVIRQGKKSKKRSRTQV
jgi:GNAT superfamily N-acetyltransferase